VNRLIAIGAIVFLLIAFIVHHNHTTQEKLIKAQEAITQRHTEEAQRIAAEAAQATLLKQQREARENNEKSTNQALRFYGQQIDKYQNQTSQIGEYNQVLIKLKALLDRWKYTSDPRGLQAIRRDIDNMPAPECLNDAKSTLSATLGNESSSGNEEETRGAFKVFLTEFNLCVREVTARSR
jgi:hypothetical protein